MGWLIQNHEFCDICRHGFGLIKLSRASCGSNELYKFLLEQSVCDLRQSFQVESIRFANANAGSSLRAHNCETGRFW